MKDQQAILNKLSIQKLNPMQLEASEAILKHSEIVLLSPTGTGKTLAFLLPVISELDANLEQVQVLILVPSRELAIQIEQVARGLGSGYKVNAVYGGKSSSKDKLELKSPPAILIGTPGRIADHIRKKTFITNHIKTLVLDEFDKSLEVGFEQEMKEITRSLGLLQKKILTSATKAVVVPSFVGLKQPKEINYLTTVTEQLTLKMIIASTPDKLDTLLQLLGQVSGSGIIFCNFKDTIEVISKYLNLNKISHTCFFGGLEQSDRERALIKFRNGTERFLIATDLAARGIDVPELDFIVHYQLPMKEAEFIHRNGRTARMNSNGTAYLLKNAQENLPNYLPNIEMHLLNSSKKPEISKWQTLYISGGRKDKISKGDIVGLFIKQGNLTESELGIIELKQDCAYVAVPLSKVSKLVKQLNNVKLKTKKVRIGLME